MVVLSVNRGGNDGRLAFARLFVALVAIALASAVCQVLRKVYREPSTYEHEEGHKFPNSKDLNHELAEHLRGRLRQDPLLVGTD